MFNVIFSWPFRAEITPNLISSVQKTMNILNLPKGVKKLMFCSRMTFQWRVSRCLEMDKQKKRQTSGQSYLNMCGLWRSSRLNSWMFSNCVSSCSCEPTCFLHCAPQHDGRTDWAWGPWGYWLVSGVEVNRRCLCWGVTPLHSDSSASEELSLHIVCHGTSEGDPYFIYEYAAWSFLIFNKEIWFTNVFLMF